ncbi:VOC family protein [Kaarinaea lacus]
MKDPRQDNCSWMMPMLTVRDIAPSLQFYAEAFGFEPYMQIPDENGNLTYADLKYKDNVLVMLNREGSDTMSGQSPVNSGVSPSVGLYVYCDDVDALMRHAQKVNATIISEAENMCWGDRVGVLKDPDGYRWSFATKVAELNPAQGQ